MKPSGRRRQPMHRPRPAHRIPATLPQSPQRKTLQRPLLLLGPKARTLPTATVPRPTSSPRLLNGRNQEMGHNRPDNHGRAEHDQNPPIPLRTALVGRRAADVVVGCQQLDEDRPQFAECGAQSVACCAVAGWVELCGEHVCCCVGA